MNIATTYNIITNYYDYIFFYIIIIFSVNNCSNMMNIITTDDYNKCTCKLSLLVKLPLVEVVVAVVVVVVVVEEGILFPIETVAEQPTAAGNSLLLLAPSLLQVAVGRCSFSLKSFEEEAVLASRLSSLFLLLSSEDKLSTSPLLLFTIVVVASSDIIIISSNPQHYIIYICIVVGTQN